MCSAVWYEHHNGVIMDAMASQITSLTIVYSTVYSDADQRIHQSSASLDFVRGPVNSPQKMASNAENVFIWWRHHVYRNYMNELNGNVTVSRARHLMNHDTFRLQENRGDVIIFKWFPGVCFLSHHWNWFVHNINNNDNVSFYSVNFKQQQIVMFKNAYGIRHTPDTSWHLTKYTQYDKMSSCIMNMKHQTDV